MTSVLLKLLSDSLIQALIIEGLEHLAKRSDNTVDDKVVKVVKNGLANYTNPINRVQ